MSIQFRSRISAQYSPVTITGNDTTGWCCGSSQITTRAECSDSYFAAGFKDNSACPTFSTCAKAHKISSGACCYWSKSSGIYSQKCEQTDTQYECYSKSEGNEEGLDYQYYPGSACQSDGGDILCNGVVIDGDYETQNNCNSNSASRCYSWEYMLGNCCTQTDTGKIECEIKSKMDCSGFWQKPKEGIYSCVDSTPCSGVYFSGLSGGETPASASLTTLNASTNSIEKIPNIGEYYQGGIYLGIFTPGTPVNSVGSVVYGNQITGLASNYKARETGLGTKEKSWMLIADTVDFEDYAYTASSQLPKDLNNSVYDGLYNTYSEEYTVLFDAIKLYRGNGFRDWYLPSQDELAFYFKNIQYSSAVDPVFNKLQDNYYLTSTPFTLNGQQNFNENWFVVAQLATETDYGRTIAVPQTTVSKIRLFRRIYLKT